MEHDAEHGTAARAVEPVQAVCVIEDDAGIRKALRHLLEDEDYRVLEAHNGLDGLALLRGSPERLVVLLDHRLPEIGGCDLVQIVAGDATLRERHAVIFVTASPRKAEEECGETLEELGAPLIPKPFHIDEVLEQVAQAAMRIAQ